MTDFSVKDRLRFRKLLEVANSSTFDGEREAALAAATRLAENHGMSLREAAGMSDHAAPRPEPAPRSRRPGGFPGDFGARMDPAAAGTWRTARGHYHNDIEQMAAEKRRHDAALADAIRRGLDAEERAAQERRAAAMYRRPKRGGWRAKPEFIRVLLRETSMSAKDIAATVGVTIYDVFKEKLLMRIRA